jgi:predicted nucleic acid-binding protein
LSLIFDTNVIYASLDRRDEHHEACRALIESAMEPRIIPAPVIVEVDYFARKLGILVELTFLDDLVSGAYHVEELRREDYARIREICRKYSDSDIGFVDASVAAIAERLNEPKIATLDHRHFSLIRPRHADRFELLPARRRPKRYSGKPR